MELFYMQGLRRVRMILYARVTHGFMSKGYAKYFQLCLHMPQKCLSMPQYALMSLNVWKRLNELSCLSQGSQYAAI